MATAFNSFGPGEIDSFDESPGFERQDAPLLKLRVFLTDVLLNPDLQGHITVEEFDSYSSADRMLIKANTLEGQDGFSTCDDGTVRGVCQRFSVPAPFAKTIWSIKGMAETVDLTLPHDSRNSRFIMYPSGNGQNGVVVNAASGQSGSVINLNRRMTLYLPAGAYAFSLGVSVGLHLYPKTMPEFPPFSPFRSANWSVCYRNVAQLNPLKITSSDIGLAPPVTISKIQCLQVNLLAVRPSPATAPTTIEDLI